MTPNNPFRSISLRRPKTSLMQLLVKAWKIARTKQQQPHLFAEQLAFSTKQTPLSPIENAMSRRRFIRQTALATLSIGATSYLTACRNQQLDNSHSIAIVGAGMAGLRAANVLKKSGIDSTVFEAADRTGGRIYSANGIMGNGLTTELGGEFIDSIHDDMLQLVDEYGLDLLDTQADSETSLIKDAYFFNGQLYSLQNVIDAFVDIAPAMQADIDSVPDAIGYFTPEISALDNLSISQYLANIGVSGWLKSLIEVAYITEYGLEADQQSAINLLFLISADTSNGSFDIFGESDERYKVKGGNQQIVDKLAEEVNTQIKLQHKLVKIKQNNDAKYTLTFDQGNGVFSDFIAEFIIMTLPFSVLRDVDLSGVPLPARKLQAINELGYGTNAKLFLGFDQRQWRTLGYVGSAFSDNGLQLGWDSSQLQNNNDGVGSYTVFTGGNSGIDLGSGSPSSQADIYLPKLDEIFPGSADLYNQTSQRFHWPTHPFSKGSYACYKVGQVTSFGSAERESAAKMFFAGEHCSADYQGYMNGAAETGRIAAEAILQLLL